MKTKKWPFICQCKTRYVRSATPCHLAILEVSITALKLPQNAWYSVWFPVNFLITSFCDFTFFVRFALLPNFFHEFTLPAKLTDFFSSSLLLFDVIAVVTFGGGSSLRSRREWVPARTSFPNASAKSRAGREKNGEKWVNFVLAWVRCVLPWVNFVLPWINCVLPWINCVQYCRELILFCRHITLSCRELSL